MPRELVPKEAICVGRVSRLRQRRGRVSEVVLCSYARKANTDVVECIVIRPHDQPPSHNKDVSHRLSEGFPVDQCARLPRRQSGPHERNTNGEHTKVDEPKDPGCPSEAELKGCQ